MLSSGSSEHSLLIRVSYLCLYLDAVDCCEEVHFQSTQISIVQAIEIITIEHHTEMPIGLVAFATYSGELRE